MMTLYYSPDTYSLAAQIILHETGLPFTLLEVDLCNQSLPDGTDFHDINPKGYVPLLELEGGERIGEVAIILTYLADQVPHLKPAPAHGTMERIRLLETVNFIATEMHKANSFLLSPRIDVSVRRSHLARLRQIPTDAAAVAQSHSLAASVTA
ncbi:glutathione S-transferase N-terminal domain-containing protein, partial [Pseudomonas sp. CDFA 602]